MNIELTLKYTIKGDLTAAAFIARVDQELGLMDMERLDSLDMGDAGYGAVTLHNIGQMQDMVELSDQSYNYIDCPDKGTILREDEETGQYKVIAGTNLPEQIQTYKPCPRCGWSYDDETLALYAKGRVSLDPNPTHACVR